MMPGSSVSPASRLRSYANLESRVDILVVGAGPAGIAAACSAAAPGSSVVVFDDNPSAGGQIWRGMSAAGPGAGESARHWLRRFQRSGASLQRGSRVLGHGPTARSLLVESDQGLHVVRYRRLVLATGARELFLPFPGWTLPNVFGVGGIQALAKSGLSVEAKRVIVAGTGPLLLAVAAYLRAHGAQVSLIAEQASFRTLAGFSRHLFRFPAKISEAVQLQSKLIGVPYHWGAWVESAAGDHKVKSVAMRSGNRRWVEPCDYLAVAYGFQPNLELPALLGCTVRGTTVVVDGLQRTTLEDVYCAGEPTGIGGVDLALAEGEIAGYAAAGLLDRALSRQAARDRCRRFAVALRAAFAPRPELRSLVHADTIVCRCEDVTWGRIQAHASWRSAKLHARCGMGPCQGRVCGPAVEFLKGWGAESVRPPIFPTLVDNLTELEVQLNADRAEG
jgi:NADPH-dependent 2,4-dienoyl-CoA reductase/sulfur reductase-like enzyme